MMGFGQCLILLGLVVGNALLARLHVLNDELSARHDPISAYGIARYRSLYAAQNATFVGAGSGAALCVHLGHPHLVALPLLCLAYALGILAIIVFPMDAPGAGRSGTGLLHVVGASTIFGAAALASLRAPQLLGHRAHGLTEVGIVFVSAYLFVAIAVLIVAKARRLESFGLLERVAAAGLSFWLLEVLVLVQR